MDDDKDNIVRRMQDVTNVHFQPLIESMYLQPFQFNYTQNGKRKTWDLLEVHDSVAIIIFNITRKKVVFVKQFRPAVYYNCIEPEDRTAEPIDTKKYPPSLGCTLEMCAGIVDKDLPVEQIACEEVLEECGYKIQPKDLERVMAYRAGVGVQGAKQTLFYCEVNDDMKHHGGGGVGDEIIEVVERSIAETEALVVRGGERALACPPSCLLALMWFLHYRAHKHRNDWCDRSFEFSCGSCKEKRATNGGLTPIVREDDLPPAQHFSS